MWNSKPDDSVRPDEDALERELKELLQAHRSEQPPDGYWAASAARINKLVDEASSGKAISISWAARVAFPGAIAILFFFIGLHYYVPDPPPADASVTELVSVYSEAGQDSLYRYLIESDLLSGGRGELYGDLFDPTEEGIEQYLLSSGNSDVLIESFSQEQIEDLISIMRLPANERIL